MTKIHTKTSLLARLEHLTSTQQRVTARDKERLVQFGMLSNKCEICGIDSWNGSELVLHMDHVDGNPSNNSLSNLRILCSNCHSQTDTYCEYVQTVIEKFIMLCSSTG